MGQYRITYGTRAATGCLKHQVYCRWCQTNPASHTSQFATKHSKQNRLPLRQSNGEKPNLNLNLQGMFLTTCHTIHLICVSFRIEAAQILRVLKNLQLSIVKNISKRYIYLTLAEDITLNDRILSSCPSNRNVAFSQQSKLQKERDKGPLFITYVETDSKLHVREKNPDANFPSRDRSNWGWIIVSWN